MDPLTAAAINFTQSTLSSKIDYAVAGKMLQAQDQRGSAALELIQAATNGINKSGDALVAAATGLGGQTDTYA